MILAFKLRDLITIPFGWLLGMLNDVTGNFLRQQIDRVMANPAAYRDNASRLREIEAQNNLAAREILGIPAVNQ